MLIGLLASGLSTGLRLLALGIGAVALFIGVSMLAPKLVPPLVRVLGWPATRFGGAAGKLAQGNSARNPARTASTASALMIGLALVTLVGVLAAGLRTGFEGAVNQVFVADYAVTATNNFSADQPVVRAGAAHRPRGDRHRRRAGGRREGVRLAHQRHRRPSERQPGDPRQLEGREPADAGAARERRRVRRQGLRQGPAPADRLAALGRDSDRQVPAPEAHRHLLAAEGRVSVRGRHDLDGAVRSRLPEPAEPVHVREHPGWRQLGQHGQAATRRWPDSRTPSSRPSRSSRTTRCRGSTRC